MRERGEMRDEGEMRNEKEMRYGGEMRDREHLKMLEDVLFDIKKRGDRRTDGRTYGHTDIRTDGHTDGPSYRDARTHLKMGKKLTSKKSITSGYQSTCQ